MRANPCQELTLTTYIFLFAGFLAGNSETSARFLGIVY